MKPQHWVPLVVFLAVSVPVVMLLNLFEIAGEYRLWIAIAAGALATAYAQSRLKSRGEQE